MEIEQEKHALSDNSKLIKKVYNFIDRHANLPIGIILINILHVIFCYLLSENVLHTDAYCHYSWMRITRRVPLKNWYDSPIYTHLDYPPLAAYVHWLLSFIIKPFDPKYFDNSDLCVSMSLPRQDLTREAFLGLRFTVFIANTLTYNIALPYVICSYYKAYRPAFKLFMIALFLFPTYYLMIDFGDTQINGLHYSFVILGLLEITRENFGWATFYWTLGALYKHITLLYALPIVIYILYKTYQKYRSDHSKFTTILYTISKCAQYGIIALFLIFIVFLPFLQYKGVFKRIIHILFFKRDLIDTTPTFWYFTELFLEASGKSRLEVKAILVAKFLILPNILIWVKLFKKANKISDHLKFLMMFSGFALIYFIFGYSIHTKHIMYYYFGLLFMMPYLMEYFTFTNMIFAMAMFCQSFRYENQFSAMYHGFAYIAVSWLFEENNVKALEFHEYAINQKKDIINSAELKFHYFMSKNRRVLTAIMLFILGICLIFLSITTDMYEYDAVLNFWPVERVAFNTGFFALMILVFYYFLTFSIS